MNEAEKYSVAEPPVAASWQTAMPETIISDILEWKKTYMEANRGPWTDEEAERRIEAYLRAQEAFDRLSKTIAAPPAKPYWAQDQFKKRGRA